MRTHRTPGAIDPILIADDDPMICDFISQCLDEIGYETDVAYDAVKTFDLVSRRPYSCILLDCHFGSYERGLEIIRPLMRLAPHSPIVMISADTCWRLAADALKLGAFVFWRKTDGFSDLLKAIGVSLEEHQRRQQGFAPATLDDVEREAIYQHLQDLDGHLSHTARDLDRELEPVSVMMKKHGIPQWR